MFKLLGWLGLTPFGALVLTTAWPHWMPKDTSIQLFIFYSAIILSFLTGSYWERARQQDAYAPGLIASNIVALLAYLALGLSLYQHAVALGLLGVLYLIFLRIELRSPLPIDNDAYRRMRIQISLAVVLCHIALLLAL